MKYRIQDIDKNFTTESISGKNVTFIDLKRTPLKVCGLLESADGYRRLPHLEGAHYGVNMLAPNTAGAKVRFKTDSPYFAVRAEIEDVCHMAHMTLTGSCGFALYTFDGKEERFFRSLIPSESICHGGRVIQCCLDLPCDIEHEYVLYFPLYNGVKRLDIGLAPDCCMECGSPYRLDGKPIVYYGSSITQGGCASQPGNAYPALITHKTNIDHINLGFSGSCVGDECVADYIAGLDMSAFVLDYDYNAKSAQYLEKTHEPFFKKVRAAHPTLPVIMVSAPCLARGEDDDIRRSIIKKTWKNAISAGDENVYFVDGATLFDGIFSDGCTVDGLHPNDLGFSRMAEKLLPVILKALHIEQ